MDFTEYVSRTFTEETGKQLRYSYGIMEIMFDKTGDYLKEGKFSKLDKHRIKMYPGRRFYDLVDRFIYFCSYVNTASLIPATLLAVYSGYVYHIWGGFFCNLVMFTLFPLFFSMNTSRSRSKDEKYTLSNSIAINLAFLGHAYAVLKGIMKYFADPFKRAPKPFGATSVDSMDYSFVDGVKIIAKHFTGITSYCCWRPYCFWSAV